MREYPMPTMADFEVAPIVDGASDQLLKALQAGQITGQDTIGRTDTYGAELKVESLDKTIKTLTHKENDLVTWRRVPKDPAFNTVEEFIQQTSYGSRGGIFNGEGELPIEVDGQYVRRDVLMKFMGKTVRVTHPATLMNTVGVSPVEKVIKNGTMALLRDVDAALVHGNASNNVLEFDGIYEMHKNSDQYGSLDSWQDGQFVVDLRGGHLKQSHLGDAALSLIEAGHADPDLFMAPPSVIFDYAADQVGQGRIVRNNSKETTGLMTGQKVDSYQSQGGLIELAFDKFMRSPGAKFVGSSADRENCPPAVTAGTATVPTTGGTGNNGTDPLSRWSGFSGDYFYGIAAMNRFGEGPVVGLNANALTTVGTKPVELAFTDNSSGQYAATAYVVYRSEKNPTTDQANTPLYPIFTVPKTKKVAGYDGGAAGVIRDRNRFIANCEKAFMAQFDTEVLAWAQLLPLMKMPLAQIDPSIRYALLLYGAMKLFAPSKIVQFINVGRLTTAS